MIISVNYYFMTFLSVLICIHSHPGKSSGKSQRVFKQTLASSQEKKPDAENVSILYYIPSQQIRKLYLTCNSTYLTYLYSYSSRKKEWQNPVSRLPPQGKCLKTQNITLKM